MTEVGAVRIETDGPIGWIKFDNPARRNAVSLAMWQALHRGVAELEAADEIRVIVVRGVGEQAFVSGADISEFDRLRSSAETVRVYNQTAEAASEALRQVGKPTLAMIHGYCIGGGVAVALSCDLRIAAQGSRFGVPAAKLGLGYEFKGVRKLVELVGAARAKQIFYTARQFSADEAMAMGLVNQVVAATDLEAVVRDWAASIAANAPLTVSSIKTLVDQVLKDESQRDMALCQRVVDRCFDSADYAEGRSAFLQKRTPRFTGR